jgi:RNA:NAD 2'-phosphotransferase (TPT1/KptA family)
MDNEDRNRKGGARDEIKTTVPAHKNEDKSLVLLQVNCRNINKKALEFWKSVNMYNLYLHNNVSPGCISASSGDIFLKISILNPKENSEYKK